MLHKHVEKKRWQVCAACFRTISTTRSSGTSSPDCMWALASQVTRLIELRGFLGGTLMPYLAGQVTWRPKGVPMRTCKFSQYNFKKKKTPTDAAWTVIFFYQDTDLTAQHIARGDVVELKILKLTFSHSHKVVTTDSPGDFCTNFQLQHRCSVPGSFSCWWFPSRLRYHSKNSYLSDCLEVGLPSTLTKSQGQLDRFSLQSKKPPGGPVMRVVLHLT